MIKARVTVTAPDALKDGLAFNSAMLPALQIVGLLKPLGTYERRTAITTALAILKADGYPVPVEAWTQ